MTCYFVNTNEQDRSPLHLSYSHIVYHDGLNNILEYGDNCDGEQLANIVNEKWGFLCYNLQNLGRDVHLESYIRFAIIPPDAILEKNDYDYSIVTDKVILTKKYHLYSPKIVKFLIKNNINLNQYFIENICSEGCLESLQIIKDNNIPFDCSELLYAASKACRVDVLEWIKNLGLPLQYSTKILDWYDVMRGNSPDTSQTLVLCYQDHDTPRPKPCQKNFIKVFEWWLNSGLELKYSEQLLSTASHNGHVEVLQWWKDSGLPLKYDESTLDNASSNDHIDVLNWWINSELPLKYSESGINMASGNDCIDVLNWWVSSGLPLKYSELAMSNACHSFIGVDILNWWVNSGLPLKYNEDAMDSASMMSNINVLEWWKNSGLPLKYSELSSPDVNFQEISEWWKNSGLPLK